MTHYASRFDIRTACRKDIADDTEVTIRRDLVTCVPCRWRISPPRARRSSESRGSAFIRDASARSSWGCPRALTRYAIDAANAALMGRFQ